MNEYHYLYTYYKFFNRGIVVLLRYALFFASSLVIFLSISDLQSAKLILIGYVGFLVNELFIHIRLNKMRPRKTVDMVSLDTVEAAMFFRTQSLYDRSANGFALVNKMAHYPENVFLLHKINGNKQVPEVSLSKKDVLVKAYALVKSVKGKYISPLDIFAAYILLAENEKHMLQSGEMDEQDFVNIYYWARNAYKVDEKNAPLKLLFYGDGAFDFFIYGWSTELKKYALNITNTVLSQKHPPRVIGRSSEYEELLVALNKAGSRNVLLVGDPGTGKTSLVEYFAYNSHMGHVPGGVSHMQVYELFIDRLLAGVSERGELEDRLVTVIDEVLHAGNVILLIQNIENIFGAGGFDFDISGVLYKYLKNGGITIIGTTTQTAYKTHIASHEAIATVFTTIQFPEPDPTSALFMLFERIGDIERQYRCEITYSAVKSLIDLSSSYLTDRYLPGKAITLLESIATAHNLHGKNNYITKEKVEEYITSQTHILLGEPTKEEKQLLLHLEDELHKRVVSQPRAVEVIASAMRRVRSGMKTEKRPIAVFLFLGPTGVGKTETAKALAEVYFGNTDHMIRLDMSEYQTQDSLGKLLGESVGSTYSEHAFTEVVSQNPFSLILLDEFEKAHPQILNLFLQVFEDGRLTDNKGRTISFQNTIIIATSNAGSEYIRQHTTQTNDHAAFTKQLLDVVMQAHIYTPELINRFDEVVVFHQLTKESLQAVAKLLLQEALAPLEDKKIFISFDESLVTKVVNDSYDEQFGARSIRRYIASTVSEFVSQQILKDTFTKGSHVTLSVDSNGSITVR
ncbi:MAG TPA: ATP-dependent Clp protease ATP-binding subunit [Candidatus Levybacteria bacterium]|nr:ATP-dependent Clp protease ATP-binding subunit [Candidatus Levybacteria bacterium]